MRKVFQMLKETFEDIFENRILKLSAALTYYTVFSIPGLVIVIIGISDFFYGNEALKTQVFGQMKELIDNRAVEQIENSIKITNLFPDKSFSTIVGLIALIYGATSVFAEIQDSINMIWRLKPKPKKGRGWLKLILDRLLSFSMVISLGFILMVSLLINGVMSFFIDKITAQIPATHITLAYFSNLLLTFIVTTFLFGLIFKVLPDAKIKWKAVRAGALVTAILFMIGKFVIGYYLDHTKMTSAYGAAQSIIIILLWVYYSSVILYFGATFTRIFAMHHGMHIFPAQYAVWVEQVEVEHISELPTETSINAPAEDKAAEKRLH